MDLKGLGYLISSMSVLFLGIVAWPEPGEPSWHAWAVAVGMALSIAGMGFASSRTARTDATSAARLMTNRRSPDQAASSFAANSVR